MKEKGKIAIAKVVLAGKEQLASIRGKDDTLVMSMLYYQDEVRSLEAFDELKQTGSISKSDLNLAKQLGDNVSGDLDLSVFQDEYREKLIEIIKAKVAEKEMVEAPHVEIGKGINIMDALKKSVDQTSPKRKPMARVGKAKKAKEVSGDKAQSKK